MSLESPWFLILAPLALAALIFYKKIRKKKPTIRFSSEKLLSEIKPSLKLKIAAHLVDLRAAALFLMILALARPVWPVAQAKVRREGIDIVLAVDVSTSMRAEDFEIGTRRMNRLDVVKDVIEDFIRRRKNDRIGMIVFASRTYTVCPLTLDKNWLLKNLDRVQIGMVGDGTAIGSGIASALNRLKDTKAEDRVIILLTDGRNNTGKIHPLTAAEMATTLAVKVYTIGAGSRGPVPYPFRDAFGRIVYKPVKIDIDEETLGKIASITGARYYRATDTASLREIYDQINRLETYQIEERGYTEYRELFPLFLFPGLIILFLEIILANTILRTIP
ncbi:MAG: VWA domain-containing protein [Candidatus Omnitrophota bacterium]